MPSDRPPRSTTPPVRQRSRAEVSLRGAGPLAFDDRETTLAVALRLHVLLRDACLSAPGEMSDKLLALDDVRRAMGVDAPAHGRHLDALVERVSVVRLVDRLRDTIRRTGGGLAPARRRLVVLDVLATTPSPRPGWARPLPRLVAEAAGAGGLDVGDVEVARLWRRLSAARDALAESEGLDGPGGPGGRGEAGSAPTTSAVAALGGVLPDVVGSSPGSAALAGEALLRGRALAHWSPSRAGGIVLDGDADQPDETNAGHLGARLARVSPAALRAELATLSVAAAIDPDVRHHVRSGLTDLQAQLVSWTPGDEPGRAARARALLAVAAIRRHCGRPTPRRWSLRGRR